MNYAHSEHSVIKLDNGNVLIFGGNSLSKEGALSIEEFAALADAIYSRMK